MQLPNGVPQALEPADWRRLLEIAREAIITAVRHGRTLEVPEPPGPLARPAAVFVSLHKRGFLRGCIGHVAACEPLYRAVIDGAISAALHDPRFRPMAEEEIDLVDIEISVLSPMFPVPAAEAESRIQIGRHGLLISQGRRRGLLLPQVAVEYGWNARQFLEETCVKAGLPRRAWSSGAQIEMFSAEVFREEKAAANSV
jgi:AmmeMemoRadiSam system protein A